MGITSNLGGLKTPILVDLYTESDGAQGLFQILLLSYVPGTILSDVRLTNKDLHGVGRAVACLSKKLLVRY